MNLLTGFAIFACLASLLLWVLGARLTPVRLGKLAGCLKTGVSTLREAIVLESDDEKSHTCDENDESIDRHSESQSESHGE